MVELITPRTRRKPEYYSDFRKDLTPNLVNGDVSRKLDEDAVKESIKNLVLTNKGERLFQPNVGCNVRALLFENFTPQTKIGIETTIRSTIEQYEPRCFLISADARSSEDRNSFLVTIVFNVINSSDDIVLTLTLDRVR
jgi:phage baseplate assembly protein W